MSRYIPVLAFCVVATPTPVMAAGSIEYLLIPMAQEISSATKATVVEPPHQVTFKADDCGITTMVGRGNELDSGSKSEHYTGTAYGSELQVHGSGQVSGFVMTHAIKAGTKLSDFKVMEDGQTCSESINGKYQIFKKYSAVSSQ